MIAQASLACALLGACCASCGHRVPTVRTRAVPEAEQVAQPTRPNVRELQSVPRCATAAKQMDVARRIRRTAERNHSGVQRTVAAYRSVRSYFPDDPSASSEAAFRAAEVLRSAGFADAALDEFALARALEPLGTFGRRASLEAGHIERRRGAHEPALVHYQQVVSDPRSNARLRNVARLWSARSCVSLGRDAEASGLLSAVCDSDDALLAVRAFDDRIRNLTSAGDLEAAAGVLHACRTKFADVVESVTEEGRRVRSALARMRSPDALSAAVRARFLTRNDRGEDAEQ